MRRASQRATVWSADPIYVLRRRDLLPAAVSPRGPGYSLR
jgi:hypothetical protein